MNTTCMSYAFCCFFLCDNVVQSVKTVFTGSGCDIDDYGSHSAFRAHRIHVMLKFSFNSNTFIVINTADEFCKPFADKLVQSTMFALYSHIKVPRY